MTRARSLARLAVVCGVLGLPAACAVLEINVDVYKGPLANHQDVQVEQMAAMAIGAKPLLIELRDRLEWGDNVEARRQERAIKQWYKADFVPQPSELRNNWFKRSQAQRVNAVLSLYPDNDLSGLEKYINIIRNAKDKYSQALQILAADSAEDKKKWEAIETGFRNDLSGNLEDLKTRYQELLYINKLKPKYRSREIKGLAITYAEYLKVEHKNPENVILTSITGQQYNILDIIEVNDFVAMPLGRVDGFDLLRNPDYLSEHVRLLFNSAGSKRNRGKRPGGLGGRGVSPFRHTGSKK